MAAMATIQSLFDNSNARLKARDGGGSSDSLINLMIALLALVFTALLLIAVVILVRRMKRQKKMREDTLPRYNDADSSKSTRNHHRLTIQTLGNGRSSVLVFQDRHRRPMLINPDSPPHSPDNIPQIHITFPDEQDDAGRQKSGRVVVVRVGDATVGLEPLQDEQLPAYEKESSDGFFALDLDNMGGLKEKDRINWQ